MVRLFSVDAFESFAPPVSVLAALVGKTFDVRGSAQRLQGRAYRHPVAAAPMPAVAVSYFAAFSTAKDIS